MTEGGPPEHTGRALEGVGNGSPRWMVAPPSGGQNPAYRPAHSPHRPDPGPVVLSGLTRVARRWREADEPESPTWFMLATFGQAKTSNTVIRAS